MSLYLKALLSVVTTMLKNNIDENTDTPRMTAFNDIRLHTIANAAMIVINKPM